MVLSISAKLNLLEYLFFSLPQYQNGSYSNVQTVLYLTKISYKGKNYTFPYIKKLLFYEFFEFAIMYVISK